MTRGMEHAHIHPLAGLVLAGLVLLAAFGCTAPDEERLSAMEADIAALKERDAAGREELAAIRKNLEAIQDLLKIDRDRAGLTKKTAPEGESEDEALDSKAKAFVDKNLDRLIEVTKKLLDKMEKELDEQLEKMKDPAPPKGTRSDGEPA